ncbi:30S ribosomal protein S17 [Borreliella lusitaniae]|uniref:Small ribosomal subunit protein uS17 n=1 Tax=Borreliella lusitaniae TaxID=100177 RepID=A0ABZ0CHN3_9SPIR|nr:30S ribosomal protein S17 [Borreliella lusitaniae]WKC85396.1 30S ribosomal protein S17 [Borreliella lusitaniae]WNY66835.1 30S ribosomal protein S17 [Borreliella lusitaniae]WNY68686.1 30S ribosomal protein S17 [Borreliella lusitaniae]
MARENKKELIGIVVSDKMSKTIVVEIVQRKMHPIYRKYLKVSKKVKAHDDKEVSKIGDKVKIIETRPISKDKRWSLVEVLEKLK